jgi:hypothetical protein
VREGEGKNLLIMLSSEISFLFSREGGGGRGGEGHLSTSLSSEMEATSSFSSLLSISRSFLSTSFSPSFMMHSSCLLLPDTGVTLGFRVLGLGFRVLRYTASPSFCLIQVLVSSVRLEMSGGRDGEGEGEGEGDEEGEGEGEGEGKGEGIRGRGKAGEREGRGKGKVEERG